MTIRTVDNRPRVRTRFRAYAPVKVLTVGPPRPLLVHLEPEDMDEQASFQAADNYSMRAFEGFQIFAGDE